MSETHFDVIVLGAGPGGYLAAERLGHAGKMVALVEEQYLGGTCLNVGCIPTKTLLNGAKNYLHAKEAGQFGVDAQGVSVNWAQMQAWKDQVVKGLVAGVAATERKAGVTVINGRGRLDAPGRVTVEGTAYTSDHVIIATGSVPAMPPLPGTQDNPALVDSTGILSLPEVPARLAVIGGGVIGVEFASVWRSYGVDVTIIEGLPNLVPNEDPSVSKQLERSFRKRGIKFSTKTMFDRAEQNESSVTVYTQDGKSFTADYLLVAIGRGPATSGLGYEEQGISMDRGFVLTDERLRTNVPGVYAVGDIVPGLQLAHRGFLQGIFVAEEIAGLNPRVIDENFIPRVTFSNPEIASVGLNQNKAEEKYGKENVEAVEFNLAGNGKSQMLGTQGFVKLVRVKDGPIVGFHAIGARMGEQVGEGQLLVSWEAQPEDFDGLIHAHPTQNESIGEALLALAGKPLHTHN